MASVYVPYRPFDEMPRSLPFRQPGPSYARQTFNPRQNFQQNLMRNEQPPKWRSPYMVKQPSAMTSFSRSRIGGAFMWALCLTLVVVLAMMCLAIFLAFNGSGQGACEDDPCENGGNCRPEGDTYTCQCPDGFSGDTCEQSTTTESPCDGPDCPTVATESPCDGPDCPTVATESPCDDPDCPTSTTESPCDGPDCPTVATDSTSPDTNTVGEEVTTESPCDGADCPNVTTAPDACVNASCANGATCQASGDSYQCICVDGYTGDDCEGTGACESSPCMGNGTCTPNANGFTCDCEGAEGLVCEYDCGVQVLAGASCNASSGAGTCSNALDGDIDTMWQAEDELVGSSLTIILTDTFRICKIAIIQKTGANPCIRSLEYLTDDGTTGAVSLVYCSPTVSRYERQLPNCVETSSLMLQITETYPGASSILNAIIADVEFTPCRQ